MIRVIHRLRIQGQIESVTHAAHPPFKALLERPYLEQLRHIGLFQFAMKFVLTHDYLGKQTCPVLGIFNLAPHVHMARRGEARRGARWPCLRLLTFVHTPRYLE